MSARNNLDELLRRHGGFEGLAREAGQGDPADTRKGGVPQIVRPRHEAVHWLLRRNAASVLFVVIAAALLAWFVWTFFE